MTTPRDPDRLIREYLTEGPQELPDRTYDALRGDIDRTRQRVVIGPWRESHMNNIAKVALALTAVTVLAVAGLNLLPGSPGVGAAAPSPTPPPSVAPMASPTPSPSAFLPPVGRLTAGTYDGVSRVDLVPFSFTVPEGWNSDGWYILKGDPGVADSGVYVTFLPVGNLYADPCLGVPASPPVGPTVDDLALAAVALPGTDASPTLDVTLDGHAGKLVEYVIPEAYTCAAGKFQILQDYKGVTGDAGLYQSAPFGHTIQMWILDVDGSRFVITTIRPPGASEANKAEQRAIVESITFGA